MPDDILPVLNEAPAVPFVLARLPPGCRALVVDNGSDDGSADLARRCGATVVHEPVRGFGAACWAGLCAARAEVVCFMDADGSFDPTELPSVAGPVERGEVDLMLAARRPERGAWQLHARIANRALTSYLRRRTALALRDLGPMRAARRRALLDLELRDRRSGWPLEMVLRAHEAGWRIGEVDVSFLPRAGRSKVTGTLRGTVQAVGDMAALLR